MADNQDQPKTLQGVLTLVEHHRQEAAQKRLEAIRHEDNSRQKLQEAQ